MKRTGMIILLAVIGVLSVAMPAHSLSSEISNGLNYLNSTQNQEGGWGNTESASNTEYFSTIGVLDSLKQLGIDSTLQYQTGIQWIQSQTNDNIQHKSR